MNLHSEKSERLVRWLVPLALILFAVVAIYISTTFKKMPPILKRGIQPSDFPRLICGLIIFLSLLMAWFDPVKIQERVSRQTFLTVALVGMFVLLVQVDLFIALGGLWLWDWLVWSCRLSSFLFLTLDSECDFPAVF
jgi:putative tricarboxylic transport membrane protein